MNRGVPNLLASAPRPDLGGIGPVNRMALGHHLHDVNHRRRFFPPGRAWLVYSDSAVGGVNHKLPSDRRPPPSPSIGDSALRKPSPNP